MRRMDGYVPYRVFGLDGFGGICLHGGCLDTEGIFSIKYIPIPYAENIQIPPLS
jgi:hypothetical protein